MAQIFRNNTDVLYKNIRSINKKTYCLAIVSLVSLGVSDACSWSVSLAWSLHGVLGVSIVAQCPIAGVFQYSQCSWCPSPESQVSLYGVFGVPSGVPGVSSVPGFSSVCSVSVCMVSLSPVPVNGVFGVSMQCL